MVNNIQGEIGMRKLPIWPMGIKLSNRVYKMFMI